MMRLLASSFNPFQASGKNIDLIGEGGILGRSHLAAFAIF